jgi:Skp family chaperone for outer membrane proteins
MKKILFLVVLGLAIGRTASAQNAINSVHFYDVKNAV